jgi:drug/metabolite transporter (DMT)-like permease
LKQPNTLRARRNAFILLLLLMLGWGMTWTVNKSMLNHLPPIWAVVARLAPACLIYWLVCLFTGRLTIPVKADIPIILSMGAFHMIGFSLLVSFGLQYLPAGRSVVLAYTTPLWVFPSAWFFLKEPFTLRKTLGMLCGMSGLLLIMQPASLNWSDPHIVLGHGLILLGALSWAMSIVYGRAHVWVTPLFELVPWQLLFAAIVASIIAFLMEGLPTVRWSLDLVLLMAYGSSVSTAFAYWAMNTVSRDLPASVTSMGLLGVPVVALLFASWALNEPLDIYLLMSTVLIILGIGLGTVRLRVPSVKL